MTALIEDSGAHRALTIPQHASCHPWCSSVHTDDPSDHACLSGGTRNPLTLHLIEVPAPGGTRQVCDEVRTVIEADPGHPPVVVMSWGDFEYRKLRPAEALQVAADLARDALTAMAVNPMSLTGTEIDAAIRATSDPRGKTPQELRDVAEWHDYLTNLCCECDVCRAVT